jgi:8-oxo-dGTP diphosphatase
MERIRAACVIIKDNTIALMRRYNHGRRYYTFPGGGVEEGETPEQAAAREIKEEISLDISVGPLLWDFRDEHHHGMYFLGTQPKGELKLGDGPELKEQHSEDQYIPEWVPLSRLGEITLYPEELKKRVILRFSR